MYRGHNEFIIATEMKRDVTRANTCTMTHKHFHTLSITTHFGFEAENLKKYELKLGCIR